MRTFLYGVFVGYMLGLAYMLGLYAYLARRTEKRLAKEFGT